MNSWIIDFKEFILGLSLESDVLWLFGGKKSLSKISVSLDVLLDCLVDWDVEELILNGKICACCVYSQSLFVVNQNDLWCKLFKDFLSQGFFWNFWEEVMDLRFTFLFITLESTGKSINSILISSMLVLKLFHLFFCKLLSLNLLFISLQDSFFLAAYNNDILR